MTMTTVDVWNAVTSRNRELSHHGSTRRGGNEEKRNFSFHCPPTNANREITNSNPKSRSQSNTPQQFHPCSHSTDHRRKKELLNGLETVPCASALLRVHQPSFRFRCWFSNGCGYGFGFSNRCWGGFRCRLWLWFTSLETVPRASGHRQRLRRGYGYWYGLRFWRRFASFEAITRATRYGYRCWFGHGYWLWFRFRNRGGNW